MTKAGLEKTAKGGEGQSAEATAKKKVSVRAGTKVAGKKASVRKPKNTRKKKPAVKAVKKASSGGTQSVVSSVSEKSPEKMTTPTITVNKPMEKTMTQKNKAPFEKIAQESADIGRECSEACMKSATIFMKGYEDIMSAVVSLAQASAEKQAQYMKEVMSSKTINEFADLQNKIAQASFDDFMAGATKISELSVKVLTDSAEPVNAQLNDAVQKATRAMAA